MTHPYACLSRWLMVPIPLLMTACCLKNPNIYFSTGTTVGLEATPPTNETPPHVTFGYKRAELALIPVTKLDKQHEPRENPSQPKEPPPLNTNTLPSDSTSLQPKTGSTSVSNSKTEQPFAISERGCTKTPASTQDQNHGTSNTTKDAFSVLAVFHLAVNWFGPTKIEQHFATGCAATYLVQGITEEEEDKRQVSEARSEIDEAEKLVQSTETAVTQIEKAAATFERKAKGLKADIQKNEKELENQKKQDADKDRLRESSKQLTRELTTIESGAMRFDLAAENLNRLSDAKAKAQSAIKIAGNATRSEVVRPQAQTVKRGATQLIEKITTSETGVSMRFKEARCMLKKVQGLPDECEARGKSKVSS